MYVAIPMFVSILQLTIPIRLTLKECTTPTNRISNASLPLEHIAHVPDGQIVPSLCIFRKYVFEFLRQKAPFGIVRSSVTAMLVLVHIHKEQT